MSQSSGRVGRVTDFLRLARVQNLPTAVADAWTGYGLGAAIAAATASASAAAPAMASAAPDAHPERTLTLLSLASIFAYAGGCCLNDVADLARDRRLHPARPLPSGRVTPGQALASAVGLFLGATFAAQAVGLEAAALSLMLLLGIILYDTLFKRWRALGSLTMGSLRTLNLLLGMSPFLREVWRDGALLPLPALLGLHVACITFASTYEEGRPQAAGFRMAVLLDVVVLLFATFGAGPEVVPALATGLPLAAAVALRGVQAVREMRRNLAFEVVKVGVVGILLLDATFLLAHGRPAWAAAVMALFVPRALLGRVFRGT
ncbi:MAG: UbiA family prenyltransferase [Planctomycetes bacterium]|nr:UbiA family prenyltransferase [Planctomycetota bacterium]